MVSVFVENKGAYCCLSVQTFKNDYHEQFICCKWCSTSHTTTTCAHPTGPGNMLSPSKTVKHDWKIMIVHEVLSK
jgi:hypothetical protein